MTNDPRYSPPPQQPGYRTAPNQPAPPAYAQGHQQPYNQPFDWRYQPSHQSQPQPTQTAQFRQPYGPFSGTGPGRIPGMLPPMPPPPGPIREKRSRAGILAVGAVAIAVVSAGIGGAAATVVELGTHSVAGNGSG